MTKKSDVTESSNREFVPQQIAPLKNPQTDIPRIAKDRKLLQLIDEAVRRIPTRHDIAQGDARKMAGLEPASVHLVVTSPPYWTLKEYRDTVWANGPHRELRRVPYRTRQSLEPLLPSACPWRSPCVRGWRCVSIASEEQGPPHCCSLACFDPRALSRDWLRQFGADHLAQNLKRCLRSRERIVASWESPMNQTPSSRMISNSS